MNMPRRASTLTKLLFLFFIQHFHHNEKNAQDILQNLPFEFHAINTWMNKWINKQTNSHNCLQVRFLRSSAFVSQCIFYLHVLDRLVWLLHSHFIYFAASHAWHTILKNKEAKLKFQLLKMFHFFYFTALILTKCKNAFFVNGRLLVFLFLCKCPIFRPTVFMSLIVCFCTESDTIH